MKSKSILLLSLRNLFVHLSSFSNWYLPSISWWRLFNLLITFMKQIQSIDHHEREEKIFVYSQWNPYFLSFGIPSKGQITLWLVSISYPIGHKREALDVKYSLIVFWMRHRIQASMWVTVTRRLMIVRGC